MVTFLTKVELACIDRMTQPQLIQAIKVRAADLPAELLDRLEEKSTHRLQMILLAGRLIQVLRHCPDDA